MSLCLSRKENQSVVLEIDGAVVAVVTLRRPSGLERPISGVLAIDAGPEIEIQRDERWVRLDGTGAVPRPGYRRAGQDSLPAGRYPPPGREVGQADDAEPVDEEWLRSVGFNPGKLPFCLSVLGGEGGEVAVDVTLPVEGMEEADSLWVQGELVKVSPTRGHVRRLLVALGITPAPPDPRTPELGGEG